MKRNLPTLDAIKKLIGPNYDAFVALITGASATGQPLVIPTLTQTQADALDLAATPAGYLFFNSTTGKFNFWDGGQSPKDEIKSNKFALIAIDVTGAISAVQLSRGVITSTSAAAVSITLPTATQLATELKASRGKRFQFVVDNSAGASTITLVLGTGITVNTPAITGGAALTVSTANAVAIFEIVFTSGTTAKILRIA